MDVHMAHITAEETDPKCGIAVPEDTHFSSWEEDEPQQRSQQQDGHFLRPPSQSYDQWNVSASTATYSLVALCSKGELFT